MLRHSIEGHLVVGTTDASHEGAVLLTKLLLKDLCLVLLLSFAVKGIRVELAEVRMAWIQVTIGPSSAECIYLLTLSEVVNSSLVTSHRMGLLFHTHVVSLLAL